MICADQVTVGGVSTFSPSASQPAEMSGCYAVILTGTDTSALSIFAFPPAADLGQIWVIGFSMVLTSYLLAKAVGMVVNFIDHLR